MSVQTIETQLLTAVGNQRHTRDDIAELYAVALRTNGRVNWVVINRAIAERWSTNGLRYIKDKAWGRV